MADEKSPISVELVEKKSDDTAAKSSMSEDTASKSSLSVPSLGESKSSASLGKSALLNLPKSDSKASLTHTASKPELNKQKSKAKSTKGDLDAQTKAFSAKNTIMAAAYAGDSDLFFKFLDEQGWEAAQEIGPVGDCPFLVLLLIHSPKHLEMARRCVLEYKKQLIFSEYKAEKPDEDGNMVPTPIYFGETAMHLAVVNKNEELVDFFMGIQRELHEAGECKDLDLLTMPALGVFFAPPLDKGPCYYGEVPLGFAACTANISMCSKLLHTYGADLQFEDSHGNNLLHLLALHNLPDMFKYILQEEKASVKSQEPGYVPLAQRKNHEGVTPLGLAGASGNKEVFGIIIDSSKVTVWTYGPIEMIKFPLEELDTLDLAKVDKLIKSEPVEDSDEDRVGTIELLIREGHLELLMQNVLIDVLDNKWTRYAFRRYLLRCLKQSILILSVTLSLILGYPDPAAYDFYDASSQTTTVFRVFFEIIVVYMVANKGFSELNEMRNAGLRDYYGDVGVAFLENALASSYCFFIFCVVIVRIVGIVLRTNYLQAEGGNSTSVYGPYWAEMQTADPDLNYEFPSVTQHADIFFQSIAVMLIYLYALTLLLGFRLTGQFVIMIYKMLRNDVLRFCMVFFLFILGFATSFLALQSVPYPEPMSGWEQLFANVYGLFQVITSGVDFEFAEYVSFLPHLTSRRPTHISTFVSFFFEKKRNAGLLLWIGVASLWV